jgi:hypothetical protein
MKKETKLGAINRGIKLQEQIELFHRLFNLHQGVQGL